MMNDTSAENRSSADSSPPEASKEKKSAQRIERLEMRRRSFARQEQEDSGLMKFGALLLIAVASVLAWYIFNGLIAEKPNNNNLPMENLFHGQVQELDQGLVRITYDFKTDPAIEDDKKATPGLRDWIRSGVVERSGVLVSGDNSYRPFFQGDRLSVQVDFALLKGHRISIFLCCPYDDQDGDFYRLDLTGPYRKDWPSTAQILEMRENRRKRASAVQKIMELKSRENPPLFYTAKFELADGMLTGWCGKLGGKLEKVCEMKAGKIDVGNIVLRGPGAGNLATAFDNVVIIGRPHPKFTRLRSRLYRFLGEHPKQNSSQTAESSASVTE
jgi:hypothetical protein